MLNRFKNALYGSSGASDDTPAASIDYDYREAVLSKRIRSALSRSSSFREDLLSQSGRNRNNNNNTSNSSNNNTDNIGTPKLKFNFSSIDNKEFPTSKNGSNEHRQNYRLPKFRYSRPEFLQLKTDDEILVSADHQIRPIILPRDVSRLPWKSGYAECINAGKSMRNEDQAANYQDVLIRKSTTLQQNGTDSDSVTIESKLPWVYFGIFDGHAGTAVAVAAATQLHNIIGEKLGQVADLLIALEFESDNKDDDSDEYLDCTQSEDKFTYANRAKQDETSGEGIGANAGEESNETSSTNKKEGNKDATPITPSSSSSSSSEVLNSSGQQQDVTSDEQPLQQTSEEKKTNDNQSNTVQENKPNVRDKLNNADGRLLNMIDVCRNNITVDSLVTGALESAFWEMDSLIADDKHDYKMPGGCTAIVGLFILGKLYVCNAGDSRAIVYKNDQVIPMSFDFTPTSERERILRLGLQRPEFLGNDFTHLEFIKRPTRRDLGKQMLYKDAYMTGWSMKTITYDDLRFPLVWGEGKRSRVLATIGVTRGFGDHELRAQYGSVLIKPFLTPEPEVKMLPLESDEMLTPEDVLIMGSDGLWDVTTNQEAADIVKNSFDLFPDNEESRSKYRYITAAQDLVIHSRGHTTNWNNVWRTNDEKLASLDDIAVFVIPLKQYRDEYLEWKKLRSQAKLGVNNQRQSSADESIGDS